MKNNLEDFINENRDAFDSYEPANKTWKAVEEHLPASKKKQADVRLMAWTRWSAIAAAILIVTSSAFYFLTVSKHRNATDISFSYNNELPAEYAEEVYHFTRLIELKHQQLKKTERDQPELYRQFAGDISRLDSNYQALLKELPGHPNQEVLLETMIGNLKWQIDLLNEQLNIIQKIKQSKKSSNEKTTKFS